MWKFLAVPFAAVLLMLGAGQAPANPAYNAVMQQHDASGVTLAGSKNYKYSKRRWPHGNHYRYRHHHHHHHHHYRPRYYYRPYWGWNDCIWGYGYSPYGCYGSGFYYGGYLGGYYGDWYGNGYYPRRQHVSSKKHVRWCRNRYKTYNAKTDTFIGKGRKAYRCNSPYDGRR